MNCRRAVVVCAALALLPGWCGRFALSSDEPAKKEQVVVLHNGQLLKGWVSKSPGGYVVEHAAGRLVVPYEDTRVIGNDLPDAFRRLSESFPNPTAATHYELALWSWSHQLKNETRAQLVMALDRDPDHEAARDMLTRVDEQLKAIRRRAADELPKLPATRMAHGIELPEAESLAGLSRETAMQFTSRIQPLLMNKCGNSSCHGPKSETGFRLEPTRGTGSGHRLQTERNLAAVLKQVDSATPRSSPLLTVPAGNHGGLSKSIFFGPTGERQLKMLQNWVRGVSKEVANDEQMAEQRPRAVPKQPSSPKSPIVQASAAEETNPLDRPRQETVSQAASADESGDPDEDREDAFDPEIFNRRYHGVPVDKLRSKSLQNGSEQRKVMP